MKYKTLTKEEALALCKNPNTISKGTQLTFTNPLVFDGKWFRWGTDNWSFLTHGETANIISFGMAYIEVPEPEPAPFEIPCTPFKNVGERLPTAVQWERDGYAYTIHQDGSVIINGIDRDGLYRTIMSAHGNDKLASRVFEMAFRISKTAHQVHPFAVALDLELFIESLTAEDETSAIFVSANELLSDPSKEEQAAPANPFDHPAFEGWDKGCGASRVISFGDIGTPSCTIYQLFAEGSVHWSHEYGDIVTPLGGNPTLAANLPEAAEIINRLAPFVPAEVVAAAVVAFVKSKEAGK